MQLRIVFCLLLVLSLTGCNSLINGSNSDIGTETESVSDSPDLYTESDPDTARALPYVNGLSRSFSLETESEYTADEYPDTLEEDFVEYDITKYHSRTFLRDSGNESTPLYLLTVITIHDTEAAASAYSEAQSTGNGTTEQSTVRTDQPIRVQMYEQSNGQTVIRTTGTINSITVKVTGVGTEPVNREYIIDILSNIIFRVQSQVS
ncbi:MULTISPECIES: hypothetical protein [Haloarcula]|uniref:hypothetical protein n=1 Tax=Haloarcula TaxID=2237 RepID=UPI000F8D67AD|nr:MULTISPECIES: hypothetical protein [Haloarcula]NHX41642.1 hypothetical protein [Haloarcula sp. R1-2]